MNEQEVLAILRPALTYPNCAVRQARLASMLRSLLRAGDEESDALATTISGTWAEADDMAKYGVRGAPAPTRT